MPERISERSTYIDIAREITCVCVQVREIQEKVSQRSIKSKWKYKRRSYDVARRRCATIASRKAIYRVSSLPASAREEVRVWAQLPLLQRRIKSACNVRLVT